ncbi:MAG TPA: hypothetical protein VJL87_02350, partial [Bdellovibrionota bacterium]|nr:hypothetical protein [Bdellovibrionota bacterium]
KTRELEPFFEIAEIKALKKANVVGKRGGDYSWMGDDGDPGAGQDAKGEGDDEDGEFREPWEKPPNAWKRGGETADTLRPNSINIADTENLGPIEMLMAISSEFNLEITATNMRRFLGRSFLTFYHIVEGDDTSSMRWHLARLGILVFNDYVRRNFNGTMKGLVLPKYGINEVETLVDRVRKLSSLAGTISNGPIFNYIIAEMQAQIWLLTKGRKTEGDTSYQTYLLRYYFEWAKTFSQNTADASSQIFDTTKRLTGDAEAFLIANVLQEGLVDLGSGSHLGEEMEQEMKDPLWKMQGIRWYKGIANLFLEDLGVKGPVPYNMPVNIWITFLGDFLEKTETIPDEIYASARALALHVLGNASAESFNWNVEEGSLVNDFVTSMDIISQRFNIKVDEIDGFIGKRRGK